MKKLFSLILFLILVNVRSAFCMDDPDDFHLQPKGPKLGQLHVSDHCHKRMAERAITQKSILAAVHGERHNLDKGRVLCVSKQVGVILDAKTNTVITVLANMTERKLKKRLGKRDPIKEPLPETAPFRAPEVDELEAFRMKEDEVS